MADDFYGKKIVDVIGLEKGSDEIRIKFEDGSYFYMTHFQNCCEYVRVVDIDQDHNIIGADWYGFEESSSEAESSEDDWDYSGTWTFYRLHTSNGTVWIRWLGESNGYYSERVSHGYAKEDENPSYW